MSMTLILWKAPVVDDPDEARKLLDAWYETGDEGGFESSEDIAGLASELRSRWPDKRVSQNRLRQADRHNLLRRLRKVEPVPDGFETPSNMNPIRRRIAPVPT